MATKIKSSTAYINFEDFEGDTIPMDFNWSDEGGNNIDLSLYTCRMQIKTTIAATAALYTFTELSGITLGNGLTEYNIVSELTDTVTSALGPGIFYYDIQLTDTLGFINTLISGSITLEQSVTQPA